MGVEVIRADDPRLLSAGLATTARPGLQLLFVRALVGGDVAQATFIQAIDARHFLAELTSADGSRLALVTIDGTADGDVHPDLVAAGRTTEAEIQEVAIDGHVWLAQGHPVPGIEPGSAAIATLVMARPADVGLAGLFPHARAILIFSALVAFVVGALALLRARSGARS
jgi:hypothetical protein